MDKKQEQIALLTFVNAIVDFPIGLGDFFENNLVSFWSKYHF